MSALEMWSMAFVLLLATFVGLQVIQGVSRLLHTPLMSLTNAISAIAVVGSIIIAALVVGANDVVNPAARHDKSSPIYGMPIIDADRAKFVVANKRSMNPGFAGIENELYYADNTLMLFGDAKTALGEVVKELAGESGH